jgi:hypothetical protein
MDVRRDTSRSQEGGSKYASNERVKKNGGEVIYLICDDPGSHAAEGGKP